MAAKKTAKKTAKKSAKKRVPGTPWPKGVSGNPGGRKPMPEDVKAARSAARDDLVRAYAQYSTLAPGEPASPQTLVEQGVLHVLQDFAEDGDTSQIRHLWDRVIGKPDQMIDVQSSDGTGLYIVTDASLFDGGDDAQ